MRVINALGIATAVALSCLTPMATATAATPAEHTLDHHQHHGKGLILTRQHLWKSVAGHGKHGALAPFPRTGGAPSSGDLSKYALPAGDQGGLNSCVTWATGYSGYGILMHEQGISGAPMAPMYIYAQIDQGQNEGTNPDEVLSMEQDQGIDTAADYTQGAFDNNTDQPTDAERENAAHYKLSGFTELPTDSSESARPAIEEAISQGEPVAMGFDVPGNFDELAHDAQAASSYSYMPEGGGEGGHEVTIVGYNDQGVRIENSWGDGWGDGGYFTVPWKFFDTGVVDGLSAMGKLVMS